VPPLEFTFSKKFKATQVGAKIKEAAADDKARHRYGTMRIEVLDCTQRFEKGFLSAFPLPVY